MGTQATSAKASDTPSDVSAARLAAGPNALFFELEGVAIGLRQVAYDVLKSLLAEDGVELSPSVYARYCLHASEEGGVQRLAAALKLSRAQAGKLASDVASGVAMHLSSAEAKLTPGFAKLLDAALADNMSAAALTALSLDVAEPLMERLGLKARGAGLFTFSASDANCPRTDSWLKMARSLGKNPRNCAAMVSHRVSARSALSAGMRCIAAPDVFTAFEDFGGADAVVDSYSDLPVKELLNIAFPHFVRG